MNSTMFNLALPNESQFTTMDYILCQQALSTPIEKLGATNLRTQKLQSHDNNNTNCSQQSLKMSETNETKGVTTHYYWHCGMWTTSNNDDCYTVQNNFNSHLFANSSMMIPIIRVIEPTTMENINILSYYNDFSRNHYGKYGLKKMGVFKDYIFFSKKCTTSLEKMIDMKNSLIDISRLYQFESRHFQYSLLQGKITFIQCNDGSEYMIFRCAHHSKYSDKSALYGIAQPNNSMDVNHPNYQPWQCTDIVSESNMLSYFGLDDPKKISEESKLSFLSFMPAALECHTKKFDSKLGFDSDFTTIGQLLSKGGSKYDKEIKQQLSTINFDRSGVETPYVSRYGSGSGSGECCRDSSDNVSVCSDSSYTSMRSSFSHGSNYSSVSNKSNKIKNEDKFKYLNDISIQIGITFNQLIERILDSIEDAFAFAQQFPDTVLTQAYIDLEKCKIFYERVLVAEIEDTRNHKFYKFAVPIVENKQKNKKCYVAKNILTPQMAIENIMLNTHNRESNNKKIQESWLADMKTSKSFCEDYGMMAEDNDNDNDYYIHTKNMMKPKFLYKQMSRPFLPCHGSSRRSVEIV